MNVNNNPCDIYICYFKHLYIYLFFVTGTYDFKIRNKLTLNV